MIKHHSNRERTLLSHRFNIHAIIDTVEYILDQRILLIILAEHFIQASVICNGIRKTIISELAEHFIQASVICNGIRKIIISE